MSEIELDTTKLPALRVHTCPKCSGAFMLPATTISAAMERRGTELPTIRYTTECCGTEVYVWYLVTTSIGIVLK